jgi:hypothetical protein
MSLDSDIENPTPLPSSVVSGSAGKLSGASFAAPGYDIWILAGQSNMVGEGKPIDPYLDFGDSRVLQYPGSENYVGRIIPGADPLFHRTGPGNVGPGNSFGKHVVRAYPTNQDVLLVPCAQVSTGFSTNPSWKVGGALYEFAVAQATAAVALNPNNRIAGILWAQGEADIALSEAEYTKYLDEMIAGMRAAIPTAASALFITGSLLPEFVVAKGAEAERMQKALTDTPARDVLTGHALSTGLGYELPEEAHIHYNAAGQRIMGLHFFEAVALAQANITGTPPVTPGAISFVQSGTSATLTWERTPGRVTGYKIETNINGAGWTTQNANTKSYSNEVTLTGLTLGQTLQVRVSTINAEGTSAASTSSVFTMVLAPGKVEGVGSTSVGGGYVALDWTAVATATAYEVEYKAHSSGEWLKYGTVTQTAVTIGGLKAETSYDFRVEATNAGGSGAVSATYTVSTVKFTFLLTEVPVAAWMALALRRLKSGYAGPAVTLRRSSDNTTKEFSFNEAGELPTTEILTWAGAGNAFVVKWWDQSGNGHHLEQATTTRQPQIVASGKMEEQNGKPAMKFVAASVQWLSGAFTGLYASEAGYTVQEVAQVKPVTTAVSRFSENSNASSHDLVNWINTTAVVQWQITDASNVNLVNAPGAGTLVADSAAHQFTSIDTTIAVSIRQDRAVKLSPAAYTRVGHSVEVNRTTVGVWQTAAAGASFPYEGLYQEIVTWPEALSEANYKTGEYNQVSYYATP